MTLHYILAPDASLISFQITQNDSLLPIAEWAEMRLSGADFLLAWLDQRDAIISDSSETSIQLNSEQLMMVLTEDSGSLRESLRLPAYFQGAISISDQGMLDSTKYHVQYSWLRSNGSPYTSAKEKGCFIEIAGQQYLMPPHIWRITQEIKKINSVNFTKSTATDKLLNIHAIQTLLNCLPDEVRQQITTTGRINNIRLYYADSFQIEAETVADGYNVLPILKNASVSPYNLEEILFSDLLVRSDLTTFHRSFKDSQNVRTSYTLDTGRYLILSPKIVEALRIVHKVRNQPNNKRLEFLQNPRRVFEQELGEGFSGEELDKIFSDRIIGFGEKQPRVIPWIKIDGQVWWPAEETNDKAPWPRHIDIDDKTISFSNEKELLDFESQCILHVYEKSEPFVYDGISVPPDSKILDAVRAHKPSAKPDRDSKEIKKSKESIEMDSNATKPMVLYIKENLQEKEYEVHLVPRHVPEFMFPVSIKSTAKKHQDHGIDWLVKHYQAGSRGVLLADDMGLGKTFQILVFLAWIKILIDTKKLRKLPILVVAPTGLLENWIKEHNDHLHFPGLGDPVRAYGRWLKGIIGQQWDFSNADWILTTYDTLASYQMEFVRQQYAVVVFDEMQRIKNPDTLATIAAKALKADFWVGMTGTPVENRLGDLWCVVDTLLPGLLGSIKEFSHRYEKAVTSNPPDEKELEQLHYRVSRKPHSENAPAIMLRRMKKEVLEGLPQKIIHPLLEKMPNLQAEYYSEVIKKAREEKDTPSGALFALQVMRQISLHPHYKSLTMSEGDDAFISQSARLIATFRALDKVASSGEKALIFLEPEAWHHAMPVLLKRRYHLSNLPMIIMGDVRGSDRQKRVNEFQQRPEGFDIMLLSPRAGGVGLTLTAANHVFHLTRWWNPAVEDQATDRIYRIGQKKEVHVYYPMAEHPEYGESSFDLVLNKLLDKKRKLSERVLWPPAGSQQDSDFLTNEIIWGKSGDIAPLNYRDIMSMLPRQFEHHVVQILRRRLPTLIVDTTSISHDGGADVIVKNRDGVIIAIIQCKHTSNHKSTPSAYKDLKRVLNTWYANDPWCIGITNAERFQAADYEWKNNYKKSLLISGENSIECEAVIKILRDFL